MIMAFTDIFAASMIADGEWEIAGIEPSEEAYLGAYQLLVDTGVAWQLQGRIGREAHRLLEAGLIQPKERNISETSSTS